MERRFNRESKGPMTLQKKMAETRRKAEPVPDLPDYMIDIIFGTPEKDKKTYDLTGGRWDDRDYGFDDSTRSNSAKLTEEWLEEARRIVAVSPGRCESPGRLVGSPRFAAAQGKSPLASLDRRDSLSRSARRNRAVEGFSGEILAKSAKLSCNKSDTRTPPSPADESPVSAVQKWFSNIFKPPNNITPPSSEPTPLPQQPPLSPDPTLSAFSPRQSLNRKSRFQTEPPASLPQAIPSRRTFKTSAPPPDAQLLSPPKDVTEIAGPRSFSSSNSKPLSPPRKLVESAHRRSISSTTCSLEKIAPRVESNGWLKQLERSQDQTLNGFLNKQRTLMQKILNGEFNGMAKIVLSGSSNISAGTTSMVAAICYAWLLEYRQRENDDERGYVVAPVINVERGTMWKLRQAAWLFYHAGLDTTSLLFADEVDLGLLMMSRKLNILKVGQDILNNASEAGSQCTILTDNYCEDAYDLLQNPVLRKLLLAGILLDTQNLKASNSSSLTRDAEAVQLLLVGSVPNYRFALFDQLMQDQNTTSFIEALHHSYGEPPDESGQDEENMELRVEERKSTTISDHEAITPSPKMNSTDTKSSKSSRVSPRSVKLFTPPVQSPAPASAPAPAEKEDSRGKNKFFLAKWFNFGSK